MGRHRDHRGNHPGLSHLSRGGVRATRGPAPTLALLLWVTGGLIAIAGALTYAELGTMFPEAGGQYHYLKQAFGPLGLSLRLDLVARDPGGSQRLPRRGVRRVSRGVHAVLLLDARDRVDSDGTLDLEPNTAQLAGVSAIAVLSVVNYFGTKQGARSRAR